MVPTCRDCVTSEERMHHGFTAQCIGCKARAASRSPIYWRAARDRVQDRDYREMLERFGLTHQQVLDAHAADAMNREKA